MSSRQGRAKGYIQDLLDACERVARYNEGKTREAFLADTILQDATVRNLEILGEASRQLRDVLPDAYERFPAIPFTKMYALRNNLAHGYLTVDMERI
ncbi:MAG TPA: HepT-like ribonuclease domain-containing protein [Bryocella sp.]|nr:HepT-like ribonuclease domain-containing protein [Bryocella sp.]